MGFLSGLGRVLAGKPVFQDGESTSGGSSSAAGGQTVKAGETPRDNQGRKIIPEFEIENCKPDDNGSRVDISAKITNTSDARVELDKIILWGQKYELDYRFEPHQSRQMWLYRGPAVRTNSYHTANLIYKLVDSGDYFQADYEIEYDLESDGSYSLSELHLIRPVRDV